MIFILKCLAVLFIYFFLLISVIVSVELGVQLGIKAFIRGGENVRTLSDEKGTGTCGDSERKGTDKKGSKKTGV